MHIVLFLVIGVAVGGGSHSLLGRVLVEGREAGGWVGSMLAALGGAVLGGYAGSALGVYEDGNNEPAGFIVSMMTACAFVTAYQIATRRRLRHV